MSSPVKNKRRDMDVMKLLMSDWKVELVNDCTNEFQVDFFGPKDSPYEGGMWKVRVELPDAYPYKSPSIGFLTRIFHPNVDESAGSVCLDVINQTWSPMFDLVNVFEVFLPQLLLYPNPTDPLNGEAAALMIREPEVYASKVREYVKQYATGGTGDSCTDKTRTSTQKPQAVQKPAAFTVMDAGDKAASDGNSSMRIEDSDDDDDEPEMSGFLSSSDDDC